MYEWQYVCVCMCMIVLCLRGGFIFCVTFPALAFPYLFVSNPNYVCPRCQRQAHPIDGRTVTHVDVDGTLLDVEASFCYLGGMLSACGGCSLAIITR